MDVREKIAELLTEFYGVDPMYLGAGTNALIEYLIAKGVTVQEWISVADRLPEDKGYYLVAYRDKYNESTSIAVDYYVQCGAGEWWANEFTRNITTHWMPLPQPPKGE